MPKCEHCPVTAPGAACVGEGSPIFCAWAASGDPVRRDHVALRSAAGPSPEVRGPSPAPDGETVILASPGPALAGDLVASLAHAVGADRAAKWVAEKLTGVPSCGCASRQAKLNEIDARARRLIARLARKGRPS